ncbi:MAG: glycosyltransferase family 4 protein [Planctomycetia bacterium]|nr:glycosyltransferase family 4 protein [Planctomycetia bacterium]
MSDFAEGLAKRGWEVTALTSNRFCRDPKARVERREEVWRGVRIHRAYRPAFKQSSNLGRLLNAFWLMVSWLAFVIRQPAYDAVVLGTDPQFGYFMLPFIRLMKPRSKLVYWGFDLYPEAITADEMGLASKLAYAVRPVTRLCYRRLDGMVDIGPCMRRLLDSYGHRAVRATLVPWALSESDAPVKPDPQARRELFGDARLTVLYSGTIGKAHEFECFIGLARELRRRGAGISFCFAGRGNRYDELRAMVSEEDRNVSFAGFADESQLAKRLSAGDIHMISLRSGWEGVVVPSKFFGSLAAGRPLLYAGAPNSAIKTWIDQYRVGYVVNNSSICQIADELCDLADKPTLLQEMQLNAVKCYQENFSRDKVIDGWDEFLQRILLPRRSS